MRFLRSLVALSLLATACGGAAVELVEEPRSVVGDVPTTKDVPTLATGTPRSQPVWAGFEATTQQTPGLTAVVHGPLDVFDSPENAEPRMTLDPTTILGTTTVLAVVSGPEGGWVEVLLPVRPNESTGWVETRDLSFYIADGEIVIDLSERELVYVIDGVEIFRSEVGVGSEHNQTPTGLYFVTDSVTVTDPNSPWGPHALGLSARSDSITEFNGGDGIIGIHGTNNPGSVGQDISLGCIRLPNDMMTTLHAMVPIGTRVVIEA